MSGRTKPRRRIARKKAPDTLKHLGLWASKLTVAEVAQVMGPIRDALDAARKATLTQHQWTILVTAAHVCAAIETGGVVRGLTPVLEAAKPVLEAIGHSMDLPSGWTPHALRGPELDALDTLVWTHQRQIEQLQYNEYQRALRLAEGRVLSFGGTVLHGHGEQAA